MAEREAKRRVCVKTVDIDGDGDLNVALGASLGRIFWIPSVSADRGYSFKATSPSRTTPTSTLVSDANDLELDRSGFSGHS